MLRSLLSAQKLATLVVPHARRLNRRQSSATAPPPNCALPAILWTKHVQALYRYYNSQFGALWAMIDREQLCAVDNRHAVGANNAISTDQRLLNDHLAIRTLSLPGISLDDLHNTLLCIGFKERQMLRFPEKHLRARWYAPPNGVHWLTRLFVSELLVDELSGGTRDRLERLTAQRRSMRQTTGTAFRHHPAFDNTLYSDTPRSALALQFAQEMQHSLLSAPLQRKDYEAVARESDYGAWTLINGNRVNHCTIPVHLMQAPFDSLERFMAHASEQWGVEFFNNGAVQRSADELLLQSSTPAQQIDYQFADERAPSKVPGSFVEFIERHREGFDVANAARIFESTDNGSISNKKTH